MTPIEIVGLLIMVLALTAPVIRRILEEAHRRRNPEEYERRKRAAEEEMRHMRQELGFLDHVEEEEPEPEPVMAYVPRLAAQRVADHHLVGQLEQVKEQVFDRDRTASKAQLLVENLPSKKQLVLIHEIFGPPKGLQ